MGIASLILGLISLIVALFFSAWGWVAIIVGIVGIILGALAKKKGEGGVATAGLVLSIIGAALGLIFYLACVACIAAADSVITDAINQMN